MRHLRTTLFITATSLAATSGCAQILGFDEVSESQETVVADASVVPIDAPLPDPDADTRFACAESEFSPALGTIALDTESFDDTLELSCGDSGGSPEQFFAWQAPVDDYYIFDTAGSGFDSVLGLLDQCGGTELGCNNNVGQGTSSEVIVKLAKDQELLVAVDGFAGDQGIGTLNVERVSCPDSDLEEQTFPLQLSTQGFGDELASSCGGSGQEDRGYHWVAPNDGLFAFKAVSEDFRPIISLQEGPQCDDTELACNSSAATDKRAEVVRRLVKDQVVSISVDGVDGAGAFELNVEDRSAVACPEAVFPTGAAQDETQAFTDRKMSGSCGFAELFGPFGGNALPGDMTYSLELAALPAGCGGGCDVTIVSQGSLIAYVLDQNDCGGEEISCEVSAFNPVENAHITTVGLGQNQDAQSLTLVVAGQDIMFSTFEISMSCGLVC